MNSERLHTLDIANNRQAMKSKTTVFKMINIFYAESVWSSVLYTETRLELLRHICFTPKYGPNTTHFLQRKIQESSLQTTNATGSVRPDRHLYSNA